MLDREKVIKGLKAILEETADMFYRSTIQDTLALLKAQEPRDVVVVQNGIDRSGGWWFQCPICKMEVEPRDKYCKNCGQGGEVGMTVERMIELLEIEKECVRRNACGECNRACHICDLLQDDTELHEMYEEVIVLVTAQEPRVMTLEEYKAWMDIPFQERDPIFHEMKLRRGPVTGWTNTADCCVENYGKIERCWTSRPTDEQREAVKWL